jgi:CRP-like cAMP-binding protein
MENALIARLQLLHEIPEQDQELILAAFEPRSVQEGEVLFKGGGKICRHLFFVCKGVLQYVSANDKGMSVTYYFMKENHFCTMLQSFLEEIPVDDSICAACDAEVLEITKDRLTALYRQVPYLESLITEIFRLHMMEKIRIRNAYLGQDSLTRYRLFMEQQPDIASRVSVKNIASFLGIAPQSLSRLRKNLH